MFGSLGGLVGCGVEGAQVLGGVWFVITTEVHNQCIFSGEVVFGIVYWGEGGWGAKVSSGGVAVATRAMT